MLVKSAAVVIGMTVLLWHGEGKCANLSLDGEWEFCWSETDAMPDEKAEWQPVKVPSLLHHVSGKPFMWYRKSFGVPREFRGLHIFLRFGGVRFVSEVRVNGNTVGGHYGGWEPFEVEVTKACGSGEPNVLMVRVQDVSGVIAPHPERANETPGILDVSQVKDSIMAPIGSQYRNVGIWQPVSLIARNAVYIEDVFVRTSVRKKEIEADITLRNLGSRDRAVVFISEVDKAGVTVGTAGIRLRRNSRETVTFKQSWEAPRLWEPEDPHLYHLITKVTEAGKDLDVCDTRFGFREFWTDGMYLVLNGIRMNFLATAGHPRGKLDGKQSKEGAIDFYSRIREAGCVAMRLHANVWPEWWYEAADEVGMPIIMESALFCNPKAYALSKPGFWKNYQDHLEAVIRQKRNHPSIVMISLENEILHCGGDRVEGTEHRLAEAGRFVKKLDPTRPIMYDADGDPEGVADVVNLHYPQDFDARNMWPDVGYWLETGMVVRGWPSKFWKWDKKKPLYLGEFLHIQHYQEPDAYSTLIGDEAYLGHAIAMAKAKALAWEMQIEAYRACDVSGICPWTLTETRKFPSDSNPRYLATKRTYQKNAAFVREYDTRFYENEEVERTVYVYNDTPQRAPITFAWQLQKDDVVVDQGLRRLDAQPAEKFELKIRLRMPAADKRTPLALVVTVFNGHELAFEESKTYWVFPRKKLAVPEGKRIAVFEGKDGVLSRMFNEAQVETMRVSDLARLPNADILIIGPHALVPTGPVPEVPVVGEEFTRGGRVNAFIREGGVVIVLEQSHYDTGLVPAKLLDRGCTIAFKRFRNEQLFGNIEDGDLKFWRGDNVVCRKTILKPECGRFHALVDSGGPVGLVYLPLCEIMNGKGKLILSQLVIGEKLGTEPVAQIMLENMMRYAACEPVPPVRAAVVQDQLQIGEALTEIDAVFTDISGELDRTDLSRFPVLIAETDCAELRNNRAKIREHVRNGGTVVLHGGTREGVAGIRDIFPEPVVARRSYAVPIAIVEWDAVINGMSNQELYWYGSRKGLNWRARTPLSLDVCSHVIGAGLPVPDECIDIEAEAMSTDSGNPRFGDANVSMYANAAIKSRISVPKTGEYVLAVRGRGTQVGGGYPMIRISIDGKRCGSVVTAGEDWDTYVISTRLEKGEHDLSMAFVNDTWDPVKGEDRNVWLDKLTYGPTPSLQSKRILSPAALVKIPFGKGFYLLDQISWCRSGATSEKAGRYVSNILTNLGCTFGDAAGRVVITGDKMAPDGELGGWRAYAGMASLAANGTVYAKVRFAKSRTYRFAVKASGTEAAGEFPNIDVSVDGEKIGNVTLTRPGWHILKLEADVAEGEHKVGLSFTNDFYDPPEDRNLKIAHLEIR